MRFIKYFKLFLEAFTDNLNVRNWKISYNHNKNHNINDRIIKRTSIKKEDEFNDILDCIIEECDNKKIQGDITFVSFKYSIKVICVIKGNSLYIVTVLGKDENLKNDKIIII
jgi:hypothetical protein